MCQEAHKLTVTNVLVKISLRESCVSLRAPVFLIFGDIIFGANPSPREHRCGDSPGSLLDKLGGYASLPRGVLLS
jgi:hypothetical protein